MKKYLCQTIKVHSRIKVQCPTKFDEMSYEIEETDFPKEEIYSFQKRRTWKETEKSFQNYKQEHLLERMSF